MVTKVTTKETARDPAGMNILPELIVI